MREVHTTVTNFKTIRFKFTGKTYEWRRLGKKFDKFEYVKFMEFVSNIEDIKDYKSVATHAASRIDNNYSITFNLNNFKVDYDPNYVEGNDVQEGYQFIFREITI